MIDYHLAVARGGIGLTTVAYLAVAPEGRTHREQIVVGEDTLAGLARMADAIHETGAKIAGQVGHAGPVANGRSNGVRALSASRMPSPLSMQMVALGLGAGPHPDHRGVRRHRAPCWCAPASTCSSCTWRTATSSRRSSRPGLNRRKDRWNGSLENRARLGRQVAGAVRDEVGW